MPVQGAYGYQLIATGKPLERRELGTLAPGPEEVLIAVSGCGV